MQTVTMPRPSREVVAPKAEFASTPSLGPTIMTGRQTHDGRVALTMDAKAWIALAALVSVFVGGLVTLHGRLSRMETQIEHIERQGLRHEQALDALRPPYRPAQ